MPNAEQILITLLTLSMAVAGAVLIVGGVMLIAAGGSFYYVLAGAITIASAYALGWKRAFAIPVYGVLLAVTLLWGLFEVGLDGLEE